MYITVHEPTKINDQYLSSSIVFWSACTSTRAAKVDLDRGEGAPTDGLLGWKKCTCLHIINIQTPTEVNNMIYSNAWHQETPHIFFNTILNFCLWKEILCKLICNYEDFSSYLKYVQHPQKWNLKNFEKSCVHDTLVANKLRELWVHYEHTHPIHWWGTWETLYYKPTSRGPKNLKKGKKCTNHLLVLHFSPHHIAGVDFEHLWNIGEN